jgi:hypothetical protein
MDFRLSAAGKPPQALSHDLRALGQARRSPAADESLLNLQAAPLSPACTADQPPDYGLHQKQWAWRDFPPGEYVRRLTALNEVWAELMKVPPLHIQDFHGGRWLQLIDSLIHTAFHARLSTGASFKIEATDRIERF